MDGEGEVEGLVFGVLAFEFGDDGFHGGDDGHVVGADGEVDEAQDLVFDVAVFVFAHTGYLYLFVEGGEGGLFLVEHLLVEFLTVAEPGVFYLDVFCPA